jgi:hypothetical protein
MNKGSGETISFQDKANDWAKLAQQDPEAFETMRAELLQDFIQNSPANIQKKLECMQWKIEHIRRRANTPAEALAEISSMMWQSTQQLGVKQQNLLDICTGQEAETTPSHESAQILPFKLSAN